jgi:hypothetical protein
VQEGVHACVSSLSPVFWIEIFLRLKHVEMHSVWVFQYFRSIGNAAMRNKPPISSAGPLKHLHVHMYYQIWLH